MEAQNDHRDYVEPDESLVPMQLRLCRDFNRKRFHEIATIEDAMLDADEVRLLVRGRITDSFLLAATAPMPKLPLSITDRSWRKGAVAWQGNRWGSVRTRGHDPADQAPTVFGECDERVVAGVICDMEKKRRGRWRGKRLCEPYCLFWDELIDPDIVEPWVVNAIKSQQKRYRWDVFRMVIPQEDEEGLSTYQHRYGFAMSGYRNGMYSLVWPAKEARGRDGLLISA